jgi:aminopeptidase
MMTAWAKLLVDYCLDVRAGQNVMVQASTLATPLVQAAHNAILERGATPVLRLAYPFALAEMNAMDAFLRIGSDANTKALAEVDASKLMRHRRALSEINKARLSKRWCLTLYPTPAYAQDAGMSLEAFTQFVYSAMFLDRPDPVAAWAEIRDFQAQLIERLSRADELRIEANGTDIRMRVANRTWRNSDGQRNMPSGEVFTGPLEDSVQGTVRFTLPSNVSGNDVSGVTLEVRDGLVVQAQAETGDAFLQKALETDAGARRFGEIGIGTNFGIQRGTKNILFDEKIGGTAHMALGASYPETGGRNESALHWDLILDLRHGGRVTLDGEVFQENGKFV